MHAAFTSRLKLNSMPGKPASNRADKCQALKAELKAEKELKAGLEADQASLKGENLELKKQLRIARAQLTKKRKEIEASAEPLEIPGSQPKCKKAAKKLDKKLRAAALKEATPSTETSSASSALNSALPPP